MSDEAPDMIAAGKRWRVAVAVGFLDGDNEQPRATRALWYVVGWKAGGRFRRMREKRAI